MVEERISLTMGVILTAIGDKVKCIVQETYNKQIKVIVLSKDGDYIETIDATPNQSSLELGMEAVIYAAKDSNEIRIEYPEKEVDEEYIMDDMRPFFENRPRGETLWEND